MPSFDDVRQDQCVEMPDMRSFAEFQHISLIIRQSLEPTSIHVEYWSRDIVGFLSLRQLGHAVLPADPGLSSTSLTHPYLRSKARNSKAS